MSVLTIIIAVAVATGISYTFHLLDKDKNSMEKVKRYADKRQSEFDQYFEGQKKSLLAVKTDVEAEQMRAVAAVKRLEQQLQDFQTLTENLKEDSDSVHSIEEKLQNYDKVLDELVQMTLKVEENLSNVKKESVIVEDLNSRILEQKKSVDSIEKRIPQISSDFSKLNAEQLKAIGGRLLEEYDDRGNKIKTELDGLVLEGKKVLSDITQSIDSAYEDASTKAETLETEAFNHLSEQAKQRADAYIKELDAQKSELEANLENQVKNMERLIVERAASSKDAVSQKIAVLETGVSAKLSDLNQKFEQVYKELGEKLKVKSDSIARGMDEKSAVLQAKYAGLLENMNAKAEKRILELQEKIASAHEKYDAQLKGVDSKNDGRFEALRLKIDDADKKLKALCDVSIQKSDGSIKDIQEKIAVAFEKCKAQVIELNEKYKESVGKINSGYEAKLNEMNQKNGEKMAQFLKNIEANEDGVKKSIDELKAKNEQRLLEINKSVEETDSTLLAHLSDLEGKYNEVYGRLDSKVNEIYDDHENKYMAKIELFSKDYDARFEELAQKYSAATESLSDQISAVERLYSQKEGGINSEITQKIEELGKVYNERIENLKKSLADSFSEAKERTDLLSNATVESNGKIAALEVDLDEKMQFVRQKYTGLFEDALRKAQKEEDEAYEKLSAEARNNIEKFSSSMDSKISELKGELDGTLAVISGSLKSAIDETEDRVSRIEAKCDLSMEKISLVEPELNEKIRSISEEMQKFREEANNKIIQINGMLDDSSEKIRRACDEHEIEALKDVDLKVRTINSNIEKFQVVAENKISALSESIKSSTEKLQGFVEDTAKNIKFACEKQETNALNDVSQKLSAYKKDIEYKLSRLEVSGIDVDRLENNLKAAMEAVSKRVLGDFDSFTSLQQKHQAEFAASFEADSQKIGAELQALEAKIDGLKDFSLGNMTQKLRGFEEEFAKNLKMHEDKINEDFSNWKTDLDGKVTAFIGHYEDQRKSLEESYTDGLKQKLAQLVVKNEEQTARVHEEIDSTRENALSQIEEVKKLVQSFAGEIQSKIERTNESASEYIKSTTDRTERTMLSELEKIKKTLLDDMESFRESVKNSQETGTSSISAALGEFNTWKLQLNHQLDETKRLYSSELDGLRQQTVQKVKDAQDFIDNEYRQLIDSSTRRAENASGELERKILDFSREYREKQETLAHKIEELDGKASDSVRTYEERSKEIIEQLQSMYSQMLQDTEDRVREQNADSARKLQELRASIQAASEQNRNEQGALVMKMQEDSNAMQSQMSELLKELQNVKNQMSVYEKADSMKRQLDEKISGLEDDFERLESFRTTALNLTTQYNQICKMKESVESQMANFESEKQKIDSIGQRYESMIKLSATIDEKIRGLNTTYDELQNMEVRVRYFQENLASLSGRYDRLEQKNDVIDRVLKDVDQSFENLKELESRLKNCSIQTENLPLAIKDIQHDVDELLRNGPKITEATGRLSTLYQLIGDSQKRLDDINSARNGIGRTEQRLHELSAEIDSKFKILEKLVRTDLEKEPRQMSSRLTPEDRDSIKRLKHQGWTTVEIAAATKRSVAEVEMVLDFPE